MIWNPYASTIHGQPAQLGAAPPVLRVMGGEATAEQLGMAHATFARFCATARTSAAANPSEVGKLPDGSPYRISVVGPSTFMDLWPAGGSYLYGDSGVLVSVSGDPKHYLLIPGVRNGVASGPWKLVELETQNGSVAVSLEDRRVFHNDSVVGPGAKYLVLADTGTGMRGIWRYGELLATEDSTAAHPREVQIAGVLRNTVVHKLDQVLQYLGNTAFELEDPAKEIAFVSLSPAGERMLVCSREVPTLNDYLFGHGFPLSNVSIYTPPGPTTTNVATTFVSTITCEPEKVSAPVTTDDFALNRETGRWVQVGNSTYNRPQESTTSQFDGTIVVGYVMHKIAGAVDINKDTYIRRFYDLDRQWGSGTAEIEVAYDYDQEFLADKFINSRGAPTEVFTGRKKNYSLEASEYRLFEDGLDYSPYKKTQRCTTDVERWIRIGDERFYTLKARTVFEVESEGRKHPSWAWTGTCGGTMAMQVSCERRHILVHDTARRFRCYLEQKFSYSWDSEASCGALRGEGPEAVAPYPDAYPLLGENEMVDVGEPRVYLVMEFNGGVVSRQLLQFPDLYRVKLSMIPVTGIYLQPLVEQLPSHSISIEEYQRRCRILLCSYYVFGVAPRAGGSAGGYDYQDLYLRFWEDFKEDYFIHFGEFVDGLDGLFEPRYATDPVTGAAVLHLLRKSSAISTASAAFTIDARGVQPLAQVLPEVNPDQIMRLASR